MNTETKITRIDEEMAQVRAKLTDPKLCSGTLDAMSRISGYYRSYPNWNAGKQQEFTERLEYKVA
jgi:anaerobic ribonucleoside-triphosphate reductase